MIEGFSRLSSAEKTRFIRERLNEIHKADEIEIIHQHNGLQQTLEEFSENVFASYPLPFSVAPNFLINGKEYLVPMVTEESSVVAAAAQSAKYWYSRGGFNAEVGNSINEGHVHFLWNGELTRLNDLFNKAVLRLQKVTGPLDVNMKRRGGGIQSIELEDKTAELPNYYRICLRFDTRDAMGANYMNTCLEAVAKEFYKVADEFGAGDLLEIVMSILSNYSPHKLVKVWVECPINQLADQKIRQPEIFARRFKAAVDIARADVYRAVTHNKGMYNGIDAVALATGNDWRAIEANGHAFAAQSGAYRSLSEVDLMDGVFRLSAQIPMQVGAVGGITSLHPGARLSMKILNSPPAHDLMMVFASAGLASNFAAVRALITSGIQQGHMKMHLGNILSMLEATEDERIKVKSHFSTETVSHAAVEAYLKKLRML